MVRAFAIALKLMPLLWIGCQSCPRITHAEAIRLAKEQVAKELGPPAVARFGPYTAELRDRIWVVRASTPPHDVSGDVLVSVNARTGSAQMEPRLRTDPRKLERLYDTGQ